MKILLIGEYSNLHWTLAEGLRNLGHEVIVVSNGDVWKNYERNIDIKFKNFSHKINFLKSFFFTDTYKYFDVVQLIGCPFFLSGKKTSWNKIFFKYLKKHNNKIFLGAFGDDFYYQNLCSNKGLKYSPFDSIKKGDIYAQEIFENTKNLKKFNEYLAKEVDGIVAGCYEYYKSYEYGGFSKKLALIPFPINTDSLNYTPNKINENSKIQFFIGVQKRRSAWKGTDIFIKELKELKNLYPTEIEIKIVSDVPYEEYVKMYKNSNIIVDQLYSYSPAMNALTCMAQGKVVISGGENEMYKMIGESENFPIININPNENIRAQLMNVLKYKNQITQKGEESAKFVEKYHNYIHVAKQYLNFWG